MLDDELEPLGPLLDAAEPVVPPEVDEPIPPAVLEEPPVPELELASAGAAGVVVVDEEEEPPGTTMVSFSLVVELVDEDPVGAVVVEPPGTTVVDSFFSHADNASAPTSTNR